MTSSSICALTVRAIWQGEKVTDRGATTVARVRGVASDAHALEGYALQQVAVS
jgi:hypothetical protein